MIVYGAVEPTNVVVADFFRRLARYDRAVCIRDRLNYNLTEDDFSWTDIIILIRPQGFLDVFLAKAMKRLKKEVVLFLDDDFFTLAQDDKAKPCVGFVYWHTVSQNLAKLMKYVDLIMSGNKVLAEKCSRIGGIERSVLINTGIDEADMNDTAYHLDGNEIFKLAYYVNDGNDKLFEKHLRPVLRRLADKYPGEIELSLFVVRPNLDEFVEGKLRVNYIDRLKYEDFKRCMAEGRFSLGLAPLDNDDFSKGKYFNKYVEYTMAGIPAIYSKTDIFSKVIEGGYNGILCENSAESWVKEIERFMELPELRKEIADNAQKYAKEHFSYKALFDKLLQDMPELNKQNTENAVGVRPRDFNIIYAKYRRKILIQEWEIMLKRPIEYCRIIYVCMRRGRFDILKKCGAGAIKRIFSLK